jgi:hypothetical protein|tara:strand:- start:365 stop:706 length:342 start_codon:yes stop_codon:yes gene_type:complete
MKQTSTGFKGIKGAGPGRPKGKSQLTSLKESFLEAYQRLGGTDGLCEWAEKSDQNRGEFYKMVTKLLPREVKGEIAVKRSLKDLTNDELFGRVFGNGTEIRSGEKDSSVQQPN